MTDKSQPISPLRQRMLEDMQLRKVGLSTQRNYIRAVRRLAQFLRRSPDRATAEDLRRFQLDLIEQGVSRSTINATLTGLRFFFEITLDRPQTLRKTAHLRVERKLPVVLSPEEDGRSSYGSRSQAPCEPRAPSIDTLIARTVSRSSP